MTKPRIVTESAQSAKAAPRSDARPLPVPLAGAQFETGAAKASQLPSDGSREIAFAGRSNAGKSSAINALARQKRLAYASRTPGRTQLINYFRLRAGGVVADLPGYGYAAVPRALKEDWQAFLWSYLTTRSALVGLVLVVDARHGLRSMDEQVLAVFVPSGRPLLVLVTKVDKLNRAQCREAVTSITRRLRDVYPMHAGGIDVVAFSAASRAGVEEADGVIARWIA
ncbi:MAG TPA: ribosome biogenesis GTP-binding protein YihA/YsxC [Casimicrobiaceae bacterium]